MKRNIIRYSQFFHKYLVFSQDVRWVKYLKLNFSYVTCNCILKHKVNIFKLQCMGCRFHRVTHFRVKQELLNILLDSCKCYYDGINSLSVERSEFSFFVECSFLLVPHLGTQKHR